VRSLADAERTFEALGFRLKPGRVHANGLRNAFAKLPDGSYLELITPERGETDPLSGRYAAFLARGEGGAALAITADSLARLAAALDAAGYPGTLSRGGAFATRGFAERDARWLFFIEYLVPVHDPPELLRHPNGALGIETVWVPPSRFATVLALARFLPPDGIAPAPAADPAGHADVVGVTLRVRSLDAALAAVRAGAGIDPPVRSDARGRSFVVPAAAAHGVWLEFLEPRAR
jgi:hypothetical protein